MFLNRIRERTRGLTRDLVRVTVIDFVFSNSKTILICRFSDGSNMRNEGKSIIKKYT